MIQLVEEGKTFQKKNLFKEVLIVIKEVTLLWKILTIQNINEMLSYMEKILEAFAF